MIEIDRVAENLFDKIRSRFSKIRIGDDKAKSTVDPTKARIFNFDFSEHFDNITISLIDENNLKIYYDIEAPRVLDSVEKSNWYKFLRNMRFFAQRNGLTYDVRDIAKNGLDRHDLQHINKDAEVINKNEVNMAESRLYGTKRSSYQKIGEVRIIVRHNKPIVDETSSRARGQNIQALYIENSLGERFRLPEGTTLNGARVYARHVKNGGGIHDEFGNHISKIISEMSALKLFARNMRGRNFDDAETTAMVESAINYYGKLHRDLFTIRGQRGYEQYRALWQPEVTAEEELDIDALRDRFVRRVFDDRLIDALPVVQRAYKADRTKVGDEFESWANSLLEDPDVGVNTKGPFSNSLIPNDIVDKPDVDGNTIDGSGEDQFLTDLLDENGFQYRFQDGVYHFESKEELERAKDVIAAADASYPMPRMGIYDYGYGVYGSTTNDREIGSYSNGVMENINDVEIRLFKKLAGLTK
jgi:hypothetical protein